MKIRVLCVGKVKEEFYRKRIQELADEIRKNCEFEIVEVADEKTEENMSENQIAKTVQIEGERILKYLTNNNRELVVCLCIEGKQYTSEVWKQQLRTLMEQYEYNQITYVIGGSLGLSEEVVKKANVKLSFSAMTFPHQLMRVMLIDQIAHQW